VFPQIWDSALFQHDVSLVRSLLGKRAKLLWENGQRLSLEDEIQLVRSDAQPGVRLRSESGQLTVREREVARLVARGLTNRQIADRLVISTRTAGNHVEHILGRLRLSSRTQIAAWVVEQEGLTALAKGGS